jgi:DNA adenine methylase
VNAPSRPVLRYHGGKFRLRQWIIGHFPPHRIYVEPFGGAGSVLLAKEPSFAEVYNDLDGDVVNVFRVLRDRVLAAELARQLRLTPFARAEFLASYEPAEEPVERARRTVVRGFMSYGSSSRRANRTGFRGKAYRQNQTGAQDWVTYPACIIDFIERLQGVTIDSRDAFDLIPQQDEAETLFYCDPPYVHATRSSLQWDSTNDRAYAHELSDADHARLLDLLESVRGMVVLSGYPNPLYETRLSHWHRHERIALADQAVERTEVLWLNPACAAQLDASRHRKQTPLFAGAAT